jgi:iron complex outermembrane recepter protein
VLNSYTQSRESTVHIGVTTGRSALSLAGAVAFLLQSAAFAADLDRPTGADASTVLDEIVVTANRREEAISKAPYNISAYGKVQLEASNITSLTSLSQQVPNFVLEDSGARNSASQIPIIRGLNASQPTGIFGGARLFESPVSFYLGNTPMSGDIPLMDIDRVEVLRGPQGTLYGSGSLAGAVRLVAAQPVLQTFSGEVNTATAKVSHSNSVDTDLVGTLNFPLGESIALRLNVKDQYDAGFIDQFNIMKREGDNYLNGIPLLANPGDVAGSPAIYFNKNSSNWSRSVAERATLLYKPSNEFKLTASITHSELNGNGGPNDNHEWAGGASPIDPRVTLPATGRYQISSSSLEPYTRKTDLASLDASFDVGFATISGTLSYGSTGGSNVVDATRPQVGIPYAPYYTGVPANPRFAETYSNIDEDRVYTEEIRLVSNGKRKFDYVAGLFLQQDTRRIELNSYDPGADIQSAAANGGDTTPVYLGGGYVPLLPNNAILLSSTNQSFKDMSAYGNITWNLQEHWQITGGARVFHQTFSAQQQQNIGITQSDNVYPKNSTSVTKPIFMANSSYEFSPSWKGYVTWSQGFRRGGANSFPLTGPSAENASLLYYSPDKTNNYEVGIKGTRGLMYLSFAVFYIQWKNPQIDLLTPYLGYSAVVNGKEAASKGFEIELSTPLGLKGLSLSTGIAYAKARLSQDFALISNGISGPEADGIVGHAGDKLPGAPDFSATANLRYSTPTSTGAVLTANLGADYRGSTTNDLPDLNPIAVIATAPGYTVLHGDLSLSFGNWNIGAYATNLANKYVIYSSGVQNIYSIASHGTYANTSVVARPRELGLRMVYRW